MKSFLTFLSRNKLYAAIEALGLITALGFIILLVSFAKVEYRIGKENKTPREVYLAGTSNLYGMTLDTAKEFFPSIPEIDSWTSLTMEGHGDVVIDDNYYDTEIAYLDSTFFKMFDYELKGCDRKQVLTDKDNVIVSESFARKAFGTENAIGKRLKYNGTEYTICGVMEDFGRYDLFRATDIFFSIHRAYDTIDTMNVFGQTLTFLTLKPGTDAHAVADKLLEKYMDYWPRFVGKDANSGTMLWGSTVTPLEDVYFSSTERTKILKKGDKTFVDILMIVAFVLLASACFNYVNLTVALTGKRAKEMTMRRVLGEKTWHVYLRYFHETLLFTSVCFALGFVIAILFRPLFEEWLTTSIPLQPDLRLLLLFLAILLVLSIMSSVLPAMLVMQFKPVDVMKGAFLFRNKMVFSKVFIVIQNLISMVLIAVSTTMVMQMYHLQTLPWGYQTEDLIYMTTGELGNSTEQQDLIRHKLQSLPQVEAVGKVCNVPFRPSYNGVYDEQSHQSWIKLANLDSVAFRLLGFKIVEQFSEPTDSMCYIDRETQKRYNVSAAKPVVYTNIFDEKGGVDMQLLYKVCGVVENYIGGTAKITPPFEDMHNVIQILTDPEDYSWSQLVKIKGDKGEAMAAVKKACQEVAKQTIGHPKEMLFCSYIDDIMENDLSQERHTMYLVLCFMCLSILISALGLYAMSVNYCEQRSKEMAIRKVMGASVKEAVWVLSRRFILLSLVSIVIAIPLCIWTMRYYLQDFYYQIDFPWFVIPLAACITLLITTLSVYGQAQRIATNNPVESIKTE